MPSTIFNALQPQRNDFRTQLEQFKQQFAPGADPMQIIQQMMQQGRITQEQVNAAYTQAQQLFPNR